MNTMSPVPKDSPLMKEWDSYKATKEFANTRKWALYKEHVEGSLWAAFVAGYEAAHVRSENKEKVV